MEYVTYFYDSSQGIPPLKLGEPAFTLDTELFYIGGLNGNFCVNDSDRFSATLYYTKEEIDAKFGLQTDVEKSKLVTDNFTTIGESVSPTGSLYMLNDTNIFSYTNDGTNFSNMITLEQNNLLKVGDNGETGIGQAIPIVWVESSDHITLKTPKLIVPSLVTILSPDGTGKDLITTKNATSTASTSGIGVKFGGGGLTVVGSGESHSAEFDLHTDGGEESLYLTSDNAVYLKSNMDATKTTSYTATFDTDGSFDAPILKEGGVLLSAKYVSLSTSSLTNYYTKSQIDANYALLSTSSLTNYYTKTQSDSNYYSKSTSDSRYAPYTPTPSWYTASLTSYAIAYAGGTNPQYCLLNGVVHIQGTIKLTSTPPSNPTVIFTLPSGYRPSQDVAFQIPTSGNASARWKIVASTGNVQLEATSDGFASVNTSYWFPVTMSFVKGG